MAQHSTAPRSNATTQETTMSDRGARSEWAHGGMVFAGVLMMVIGIMGILNFSPIVLHVPEEVMVNSVNLAIELENLSYFIQE